MLSKIHKRIKSRFPEANCFLYCLILQELIPYKSRILYDHDHCILEIETSEGTVYQDRHGPIKKIIPEKYMTLSNYGEGPIFSLFDSAFIK